MIDRMRNAGRNLSGRKLGVAVAGWAGLVAVGGYLTWYGWLGADGAGPQDGTEVAQATVTSTAVPTDPEGTATLPAESPTPTDSSEDPTPTTVPDPTATPQPEEVFGYGIAINGTGGGNVGYAMLQVEDLGLGWVKQ